MTPSHFATTASRHVTVQLLTVRCWKSILLDQKWFKFKIPHSLGIESTSSWLKLSSGWWKIFCTNRISSIWLPNALPHIMLPAEVNVRSSASIHSILPHFVYLLFLQLKLILPVHKFLILKLLPTNFMNVGSLRCIVTMLSCKYLNFLW